MPGRVLVKNIVNSKFVKFGFKSSIWQHSTEEFTVQTLAYVLVHKAIFYLPRINLRLSDKAFSVAGRRAWNSLPTGVCSCVTERPHSVNS